MIDLKELRILGILEALEAVHPMPANLDSLGTSSYFLKLFPIVAVLRAVAVRSIEAAASGRRRCCMVTEAAAVQAAYQFCRPRHKYGATYGNC